MQYPDPKQYTQYKSRYVGYLRWTIEKLKDPSTAYLSDSWWDIFDTQAHDWVYKEDESIYKKANLQENDILPILKRMNSESLLYTSQVSNYAQTK